MYAGSLKQDIIGHVALGLMWPLEFPLGQIQVPCSTSGRKVWPVVIGILTYFIHNESKEKYRLYCVLLFYSSLKRNIVVY